MSPQIKPDFKDTPPPMKEGEYICRILGSEVRYGQENGTPYIRWRLATDQGGHTFFYNTPIEGRGAGMFKHFVHSAGDDQYESGEYNTDELHGEVINCKLAIKNGYYEVKQVSKATTIPPKNDDFPFES